LENIVFFNTKHPKDIGLTYFEHLIFAWRESLLLVVMVFVMFIHAIIPWIMGDVFPTYLKKVIKRLEVSVE
tara:strand:+ start:2651 stop:2863 length:213 start_codon:yes stop_codon:yes gene_type:complete